MTFMTRLKTSASDLARHAVGAAFGVALTAALVGSLPTTALAQTPAAAASTPAPRAEGNGPALWVVRDADSTLYLFGTVHVLRPTTAWGSDTVDAAFDSASRLILEVANPDDQAAAMPLIMQYGISPETPLSSLLTADELAALDVAAKSIGLSAAQMDPMRPWLAALTLSVAPLTKAGYDPTSGVDLLLKARAEASGKTVTGFETLDEQISILATFPEAGQLTFLRSTLEDFEDATVELDKLVTAWAGGDIEAIETIGVQPMRDASELMYQALLVDRNANWAGQIETLLEGSGTVFIAVGAAHLAGDDSVQSILAARGVTVERVPN
ncbi:TraB/GumN family protein [uncultured Brevundimonas sp.]|uniref:TraB/GumN family protein n=1 Tax=uncultured Brevundimonas sp. TaxID=213418 RepID=UPI0030EE7EAC|tara:strand:- start:6217 stop:7194 length:978 start_codon:yes stop_codon:yes gene_type:complete